METRLSKFEIVKQKLDGESGVLLDVGARDRILEKYLDSSNIAYRSADLIGQGHDYAIDLERPTGFPDDEFDFVAALDVLEHVEHTHNALDELIRITRKRLFVAIPNMSALSFRIQFLVSGRISGKYDLGVEHQGDRHRWLTTYSQTADFVKARAQKRGCSLDVVNILSGYGRIHALLSGMPLPTALRTYTCLFEIIKH